VANALGAEHGIRLDHADSGPGQVVVVGRHHTGVLSSLAADQGRARL
jgi:hypothetical protein